MGLKNKRRPSIPISLFYAILCVISLTLLISGCASAPPKFVPLDADMILPPAGSAALPPDEVNSILNKIQERNETVEDDSEWILRSYSGLMIRKLTSLTREEYQQYKQFLDNDSVYIIVHPGFFSFFHYPKKLQDNEGEYISKFNVVEMLLNKKPMDPEFALLQAQERRMRDFIEFKSTQNKLIVLVVPTKYWKYSGYTYKKGRDEYMRYLNEITNFSKSVLYVESRSPNRGYLTEDDALTLMEFLGTIGTKNIYVGGAYVGRCLEDFYLLLTEEFGTDGIYIVPELSDISPREISPSLAQAILKPNGLIDRTVVTDIMRQDAYGVQEVTPDIMNLP
jgi:hypothetical protein